MAAMRHARWVECGRVGRPWGVRGEFVVEWLTDSCPVEVGRGVVYVRNGDGEYSPLTIMTSRKHGTKCVVGVEDIASRDEAKALRGATFFLPVDELPPLLPGEYYSFQLLGLEVITTSGEVVGTIVKIFTAGHHDVYEVASVKKGRSGSVLIPAIKDVVVKVDLEEGMIVINPLKGLLED